MSHGHLATYLNDHLAGSALALDLAAHVATTDPDTAVRTFAAGLRDEILADRHELESLMGRLQVAQSVPRKASAWITEKLTRLKLGHDDSPDGPFRLLEAMELLSVGIEGKRLLWRALATQAEAIPALKETDLERLTHRAEDQRAGVEEFRIAGARKALRPMAL
jgi:hypothetical protein